MFCVIEYFKLLFVCFIKLPDVEEVSCGETGVILIRYHLFVKFINSIFQMLKKRTEKTLCK
jgi:uncharacterized protein (UPF0216 family)